MSFLLSIIPYLSNKVGVAILRCLHFLPPNKAYLFKWMANWLCQFVGFFGPKIIVKILFAIN